MKEATYRHTDLLNLMRWITLFFLIVLVGAPHLRQQEQEAQAVAFERASVAPREGGRETSPGETFQDQQEQVSEDYGQMLMEMGMEPGMKNPVITVDLAPMVLIEDQRSSLSLCASTPQAAEVHASSPPSEGQSAEKAQSKDPSLTKEKPSDPYGSIIEKAAERYDVDPALVKAIIMAESSYNPRAVSRKGAQGLMQLMPRTARALGVEDSFDPKDNIDAGVRYFKQLLKQFDGDLKLAIAAYNAGSRKVRMYKGIPPFKHTRYYVAKVMEYHQRYQE